QREEPAEHRRAAGLSKRAAELAAIRFALRRRHAIRGHREDAMTTTALSPSAIPSVDPLSGTEVTDYLRAERGIASWLLTRDHKRIGVMFLVTTAASLFLGGIFALVMRLELLTPERTLMDAGTYNRLFTLHGIVMVFMFMIPAIPASF